MSYPLITMSAITGKPSKNDIHKYMQSLKSNCIDQVMIYPRSGCEIEYLSDEWFNVVGYFIESAKALDMLIWLYDDFNWPSGDACGRVTAIPEFRLQAIAIKGESIGQITVKSQHNSGLFGEKFFPNLLCADAVDYFIKCTHQEYYKRFYQDFGRVIKGIFTDEPSIGYCSHNGYIPYYDGLKQDFFNIYGKDFDTEMLSQSEDFYSNAMAVISNKFRVCYLEKIAAWCKEHNVLMTGHFMCDHNIFYGLLHSGNMLKNLSVFSLPGIDEIYTNFDDECEMALFGMAEYTSGENGAMAELFALGPCDMSFEKKRAMLYFSACHKINHYFLAISHLDMRGNMLVKDFFNTFSTTQPDFIGMKELAKEAMLASKFAKKDFTPDVYVRFSFDLFCKGANNNYDSVKFMSLINSLTYNQIQWKFIDSMEDTPVTEAPIIELNQAFEFTVDKKPFDLSLIPHKVTVTDEDGNVPRGIFVRRFNDGEEIVINLLAKDGFYIINGNRVFLKKHSVYFPRASSLTYGMVDAFPSFSLDFKNDNIIRTMHLNSQEVAEIYLDDDIEVSFAIRNDTCAYLNGEEIICNGGTPPLPFGMENLYQASNKIVLKKGKNIIRTKKDFKYLPSVLLLGDFECTISSGDICKLTLYRRSNCYSCNSSLYGFGAVEFATAIDVPSNAQGLEIFGTEMLTQVFIDGLLIGTCGFSPFVFDIPKKAKGKNVSLKILQHSSIAPIFGDVDFWDKNVSECGWRGTPSPEGRSFGFSKISFRIQ